jgi:hypothetical protein
MTNTVFQYYGKFQGVRGNLLGLPGWARGILFLFALPGILLVALSIVAIVCSLAALLLLTLPVYRVLKALTGSSVVAQEVELSGEPVAVQTGPRRHVDVKIIE